MSTLIKEKSKYLIYGGLSILALFIVPITTEIIFKAGEMIGTFIRTGCI